MFKKKKKQSTIQQVALLRDNKQFLNQEKYLTTKVNGQNPIL